MVHILPWSSAETVDVDITQEKADEREERIEIMDMTLF